MSSEVEKAQGAKSTVEYDNNNVFAKILRKEIPCNFVYEDDQVILVIVLGLFMSCKYRVNLLK